MMRPQRFHGNALSAAAAEAIVGVVTSVLEVGVINRKQIILRPPVAMSCRRNSRGCSATLPLRFQNATYTITYNFMILMRNKIL